MTTAQQTPPGSGRRQGRRRGEQPMVPEASFTSYYGRPIVKPSPWTADIPAYYFLGGLAGASSLLGAGADLTDHPALRASARLTALGALAGGVAALVHDLGRPSRFHHMLRVAKPTSPMSMGTWLITGYAPMVGLAALAEHPEVLPAGVRDSLVGRLLPGAGRAGGLVAALLGCGMTTYTAVLTSNTATPAWHAARRDLPWVFAGSSAAAAGGAGLIAAPLGQSAPTRRMAVTGAVVELAAGERMRSRMGLPGETLEQGRAGGWMKAAHLLTALGGVLAAGSGRSRPAAIAGGAALLAGSFCTRFGIFHAGQQSARDPKYTVQPQRGRRGFPPTG